MKKVLYVDGGCHGNSQPDLSKRKMIAVVTDDQGIVLIDKHDIGGSNNVAELLAVKEALVWCSVHQIPEVEIRTDSMNNLSWVFSKKVGKKVSDRSLIMNIKTSVNALRQTIKLDLVWVPREDNLAGHFIEETYSA